MDESDDGVLNSFRSREMGKSILVIDTPENCASCPMGNINLHVLEENNNGSRERGKTDAKSNIN